MGLVVDGAKAVVDTGAQCCVAGKATMKQLWRECKRRRIPIRERETHRQTMGVGGKAEVCGGVQMAVGIRGVNGVLHVTVVQGVPLLLPVSLLKQLGACIDLPGGKIEWTQVGLRSPLEELPSGHLCIACDESADMGWKAPKCDKPDKSVEALGFWGSRENRVFLRKDPSLLRGSPGWKETNEKQTLGETHGEGTCEMKGVKRGDEPQPSLAEEG